MGHNNTYKDRQYFSHELSGHEMSEGIKKAGDSFFNNINTGISVIQKANESTLASNQIDLSTKFLAENNKINTKYQADPTNPQREIELKQAFDSLANQYKVNPLCQKQWNDMKTNVFDRYKEHNAQWAEKQLLMNADVNLKNGQQQLLNQMFSMGSNDENIDDVRLIYSNSYDALKNGLVPVRGEVTANEALSSLQHDSMVMYMTGLMQTNPAKALQLLNDDNSGVANDIGNGDTIVKLKQSAQAKLVRQAQINAVDRIANLVVNNNNLFDKVFDGTITTIEAQNLLQNKDVDRKMKGIIADMLGYSATSDMRINIDSGEIINEENERQKQNQNSSLNETAKSEYAELEIDNKRWTFLTDKGKLRQPTTQEKNEITSELFLKGSRILNGLGNKTPQDAMRAVAQFQSEIAQARYFGIDKGDYNKLMNDFVLPATENLQDEAKNYTDKAHWYGRHTYGYSQIEDYFNENFDDKELNKEAVQQQKALASVYYWSALKNECSKRGIQMTELKNLSGEEKASIYSKSAKNAIEQAKANSSDPQLWFRAANPQYVSLIRKSLPNSKTANEVITNIAVSAMSNPSMSEKDFNNLINREMQKQYAKLRTSNKNAVLGGSNKYDEIINLYAMQYGIDPLLVKSIIKQESSFNPNARSYKGAGGLMQLMPETARGLGVKNIYDPKQNILGGTKLISKLLNKYNGNIQLALAAYNAGEGAVKKYGNKIPPYKETQDYVKKIMADYNKVKG